MGGRRTYTWLGTFNWGPQYAFGSQNGLVAVDYSNGTALNFWTDFPDVDCVCLPLSSLYSHRQERRRFLPRGSGKLPNGNLNGSHIGQSLIWKIDIDRTYQDDAFVGYFIFNNTA